MFDSVVAVCVALFFVGAWFAYLGRGMWKNKQTIVGAVICTLAIVAIYLHYNGALHIK